jgi:hypothetical protein
MNDGARWIDEPAASAAVAELRPPLPACTRDQVALINSRPLALATQPKGLVMRGHDRQRTGGDGGESGAPAEGC